MKPVPNKVYVVRQEVAINNVKLRTIRLLQR